MTAVVALNMENKYYLYRHIRLDKNEPFYIGIGTKNKRFENNTKSTYRRAYQKSTRNNIWNSITNRSKYRVEIIFESDDRELILNKEIEFIKLYGKLIDKNGTLCNISDGGNGDFGLGTSEIARKNSSERITIYNKNRIRSYNYQSLLVIDLESGIFYDSVRDLHKSKNIKYSEAHFRVLLQENKFINYKII